MFKLKIQNIFLDKIDSTQVWTKKNYLSFESSIITCVSAEEQTKGLGRFNRSWLSPKGECIASTFYFQLPKVTKDITSLAQLICLCLAKILLKKGLNPKIKWPNDVMLSNKKLSGVLCEAIFERDIAHIFLGIGININMDKKILSTIDQPATSLKNETNKPWDKNKLLEEIQKQFLKDLDSFLKRGFEPFYKDFENLLLYKHRKVNIFDGQNNYIGMIDSITPSGKLKLKLKSGKVKLFTSGDVVHQDVIH